MELHCHTKMSDMDGVSDVARIIVKRAMEWGHEGDWQSPTTADVQAFPDANHAWIKNGSDLRCIYGVEALSGG